MELNKHVAQLLALHSHREPRISGPMKLSRTEAMLAAIVISGMEEDGDTRYFQPQTNTPAKILPTVQPPG